MNGRRAGWVACAVAAVVSIVLAVTAPASWWGVTFAAGVVAAMVAARPVVPAAYAPGWTRSTLIVGAAAVCAGGCYAFAVKPWGPVPQVAWPFGVVLVLATLTTCADMAQTGGLGRAGGYANKMSRTADWQGRAGSKRIR